MKVQINDGCEIEIKRLQFEPVGEAGHVLQILIPHKEKEVLSQLHYVFVEIFHTRFSGVMDREWIAENEKKQWTPSEGGLEKENSEIRILEGLELEVFDVLRARGFFLKQTA